jgi:hypothetical protein
MLNRKWFGSLMKIHYKSIFFSAEKDKFGSPYWDWEQCLFNSFHIIINVIIR